MNSPILVWMLYLNREVTTEVRSSFHFFFSVLSQSSPPIVKRNTKSATSSSTTLFPMRKTFPQTPRPANHYVRSPFPVSGHSRNIINLSLFRRPNNRSNDATPHDAAPSDTPCSMAGPQHTQREALDRAGTIRENFMFIIFF